MRDEIQFRTPHDEDIRKKKRMGKTEVFLTIKHINKEEMAR